MWFKMSSTVETSIILLKEVSVTKGILCKSEFLKMKNK